MQHPDRRGAIVLIEGPLGKPQMIGVDHLPQVHLDHHAARVHDQLFVPLVIEHPGLVSRVVRHQFSDIHGVRIDHAVVTPDNVRTGLFCFPDHFFIHVRRRPVVWIDKADPSAARDVQSLVARTALFDILIGLHRLELPRISGFILPEDLKRLVRRGIVDCYDLVVRNRLIDQGIETIPQFIVRRHIIYRYDYTKLHNPPLPLRRFLHLLFICPSRSYRTPLWIPYHIFRSSVTCAL